MKRLIKRAVNSLGFDIVRLNNSDTQKSVRSNNLLFHITKTGNYFLPSDAKQDIIANAIKNGDIFDEPIYDIARKYIQRGSTVIDIGSNFGQMAILFSKLVGENGIVHAFEADDFVYDILQRNAAENSPNITTHFGAVHDKPNETLYFPIQDFERFGSYGSYGIDYLHRKGRAVPTICIDEIEFDLPVSFMKIDIQGGDLFAMKGAVNTIKKHSMPIIFEYEYLFEQEQMFNFQEYVDFVQSINYRFERVIQGQNYLIVPR